MKLMTDADGVALIDADGAPTCHITPEQWLEIGRRLPLARVLERLGSEAVDDIIGLWRMRRPNPENS